MLKTALAVLLWLGVPGWAVASSLLTGAVRDPQGVPIAGAIVTGLDPAGSATGRATTDADGTFALDTALPPAAIRIECRYCRSQTRAVRPDEPVTAIVRRYAALIAPGPTAQDLRALPYVRIEDALALRPFEVLRPQPPIAAALYPALSDRGLARSALVLDGYAPAYDLASRSTALAVVPAHAGEVAFFAPASDAYRYGIFGTGGVVALSRDETNEEEGGFGSARAARLSVGTSRLGTSLGTDGDDNQQRARWLGGARDDFAGGALDAAVSEARATVASPDVRISERSANLAFERRFDRVSLRLSASDTTGSSLIAALPGVGDIWNASLLSGAATASFGTVSVDAGATHLNASAQQATSALRYAQDGTFVAAHLHGKTRIDAGIGIVSINVYEGAQRTLSLPSLLVSRDLGGFELTGGLSRSVLLTSATAPLAVAALAEAHFAYGDGRRLRAELQTYRRTSETLAPLSGSGVSITYQLTPTMSVRAWSLRLSGDTPEYAGSAQVVEPFLSGDAIWFTHENGGVRLDAIYRRSAGALTIRRAVDGDVYFPIGARSALGLRTELQPRGRFTSLVLRLAP